MIPTTSLLGRLVTLRLATVADAEAMLNALEPESTQNLQFFSTATSIQRQVEYVQRMYLSPTDVMFVIIDNQTQRLVGTIGLHEIDTHLKLARLGLLIFRTSDRGRGFGNDATSQIMLFAFEELGLNKLFINVFADNRRGQQHWLRSGFIKEGTLREEYLLNGTYHDLVRMSMLAREWKTTQGKG